MKAVQKLVTNDSFDAHGVLIPAGHIGTFDEERLNGDEPHLKDVSDALVAVPVEIAAIAPTGPNPRIPQQIPSDAVQGPGGDYLIPGKRLVGEVTNRQEDRIDAAGLREPDAEAANDQALQEIMGTGLNSNDDALVAGTVADITAGLGTKTDEELAALRAAEVDREKPRKGVLSAIDDELDTRRANSA
ncbi:MAG: hypothetical protein ACJ8FS_16305 [Sphingomicrobium sp.]